MQVQCTIQFIVKYSADQKGASGVFKKVSSRDYVRSGGNYGVCVECIVKYCEQYILELGKLYSLQ